MEPTHALFARVVQEAGAEAWDWSDGGTVPQVVKAAQNFGLLPGVVVHETSPINRREGGSFLLTLVLTSGISVASAPVHWREVMPRPGLDSQQAVRRVVQKLSGAAAELRQGFHEQAVLRDSLEFAYLRRLAKERAASWNADSNVWAARRDTR